MTVPIQDPIVSYVANGLTTGPFTFPFRILVADDLKVLYNGVLADPSTFVITGIGDDEGSVTFFTLPTAGTAIILYRQVALERENDYQFNGDLRAVSVNADFDRIWMAIQDIGGSSGRAIQYPVEEFGINGTLPDAGDRANKVLGFDANGFQTLLPLPSSLGAGDLRWELGSDGTPGFKAGVDFTPDVTTQLTLSRSPINSANCWAYWEGTEQTDATVVGNKLNFPTAIPTGISKVMVRIGTTLSMNIPAQNSVGDDALLWGVSLRCNFPSVARLRANADDRFASAFVRSYYGDGANVQGDYDVDYGDTTSADNGGSIIVDAAGQRWKLSLKGDVDVCHFGARGVAPGVAPAVDATSAFQRAINSFPSVGVPALAFRVDGQVTLPIGAEFVGKSKRGSLIPTTSQVAFGCGSFIYVTSTTQSPFVYQSGNRFIGLTFYYPNQLRTLATPIVYPYTFTFNPTLASTIMVDVMWEDVYFANTYQGIDARVNHLDFKFHKIQGMAMRNAIIIDGGGGGDYLNEINISFYYFGQTGDAFNTWCNANGQILQIGRSDDIDMQQIFIGSGFIPLRFFVGSVNSPWGPYGTIRGLSIDATTNGIVSEGTYPGYNLGMVIYDFMCNTTAVDVQISNAVGVASHLQFIGGTTWGPRDESFLVGQTGSSLRLSGIEIQPGNVGDSVRAITNNVDLVIDNVNFQSPAASVVTNGFVLRSLQITNCNMINAGAPNLNGTPAARQVIKNNMGFNEVFATLASAGGIDVGNLGDNVNLTGSTIVNSIAGGWVGREVYFRPATGSINFSTGGNILGNKTLAAGIGARYVCDGTNWSPMS